MAAAGYSYHPARTWPSPLEDSAQFQGTQRSFRDFFVNASLAVRCPSSTTRIDGDGSQSLQRHSAPCASGSQRRPVQTFGGVTLHNYTLPVRDTLVVMNRRSSRSLENFSQLVAAVQQLPGWRVVAVHAEDVSDAEMARLLQRAAALVGVHGAGLTHAMFLQPGSLLLELTVGVPWVVSIYTALSVYVDVMHASVPLGGGGNAWDGPFVADVPTVKAALELRLQFLALTPPAHPQQSPASPLPVEPSRPAQRVRQLRAGSTGGAGSDGVERKP